MTEKRALYDINLMAETPHIKRIPLELKIAFVCLLVLVLSGALFVGWQATKLIHQRLQSFEKRGTVVGYRVERFLKRGK